MICPNCRTENIEGADECSDCGAPLSGLEHPDHGRKARTLPILEEPLSRLVQREFIRVRTDDPVALAVRRMQVNDTSAVLVMEGERVAGIITATDIVQKVAGKKHDLNAVTCAAIMSPDPVLFHTDDSIVLAINKMAGGDFRHLPIVRSDRPINVIDINDVFRFITPRLV